MLRVVEHLVDRRHVPDYLHFASEKRDNRWQSTNRDSGVIKENKRDSENGYKGKEPMRMNVGVGGGVLKLREVTREQRKPINQYSLA